MSPGVFKIPRGSDDVKSNTSSTPGASSAELSTRIVVQQSSQPINFRPLRALNGKDIEIWSGQVKQLQEGHYFSGLTRASLFEEITLLMTLSKWEAGMLL